MTDFQKLHQVHCSPGDLEFASVYAERKPGYATVHDTFGVTVSINTIPREVLEQLRGLTLRPAIRIGSRFRPEVLCKDVPWLYRQLQNLSTRNIPWDRIFQEKDVTLEVALVATAYSFPNYQGRYATDHGFRTEAILKTVRVHVDK